MCNLNALSERHILIDLIVHHHVNLIEVHVSLCFEILVETNLCVITVLEDEYVQGNDEMQIVITSVLIVTVMIMIILYDKVERRDEYVMMGIL